MYRFFLWLLLFICLFFAWKAGWFDSIVNYFVHTEEYSRQEHVIQEDDGSVTTVRYRNIVDIVTGRNE